MLCAGDVETPPLVEKLLSGGGIKVTRDLDECLHGEPLWKLKWCSWERLGD
jgi:hypothetical protein